MACNCKDKSATQGKVKTIKVENVVEIVDDKKIPYTKEYLDGVMDALTNKLNTEEGRRIVADFNWNYFGEKVVGYCDQPCRARTVKRLDKCYFRLKEYEYLKEKN